MKSNTPVYKSMATILALVLVIKSLSFLSPYNADAVLVAGWTALWSAVMAWAGMQLHSARDPLDPAWLVALCAVTLLTCGAVAGWLAVAMAMAGGTILGLIFKLSNKPVDSTRSDYQ